MTCCDVIQWHCTHLSSFSKTWQQCYLLCNLASGAEWSCPLLIMSKVGKHVIESKIFIVGINCILPNKLDLPVQIIHGSNTNTVIISISTTGVYQHLNILSQSEQQTTVTDICNRLVCMFSVCGHNDLLNLWGLQWSLHLGCMMKKIIKGAGFIRLW